MKRQDRPLLEPHVTVFLVTYVRFDLRVSVHVLLKVLFMSKLSLTELAFKLFLMKVYLLNVSHQTEVGSKLITAVGTAILACQILSSVFVMLLLLALLDHFTL